MLLSHGARHVVAVDVGTGQLHHYYLQVTGALLLVVCVPLLVLLLTNPR